MFLLTPNDVEITRVLHPKLGKKVPILSYGDKTYRLVKVFPAREEAIARATWQDLTENQDKVCVLLEEPSRYSVWQRVKIDLNKLRPSTQTAYIKAAVLMIQALYGDIGQLLGAKQAKNFGVALSQNAAAQVQTAGGMGSLLRLDPLAEVLPSWEEQDLNKLLLELHNQGIKSFGRAKFTQRTLRSLNDLSPEDKDAFLTWLSASFLKSLWIAPS